MSDSPVFIMSSERSGSNLLRVLLGFHSVLAAPRPLQLLISFHKLLPGYGDLSQREHARRLLDDCLALANHPYHAWKLTIDLEGVYARYALTGLIDCFHLLYSEYAFREKKKRFVCKENNLFDFAAQIADYYSDPAFVYLYRDPRDYVASWRGLPVGPKTHFLAVSKWVEEQKRCERFIALSGLRVHCLKYEDLITATERAMTDLLRFIGVPVEEACFSIPEGSNMDAAWNSYWQNLSRPILRHNFNKYRQALTEQTITMIETIAGEYMEKLHYACDTKADWKRPKFFASRERVASKLIDVRRKLVTSETARRLASRKLLLKTIECGLREGR